MYKSLFSLFTLSLLLMSTVLAQGSIENEAYIRYEISNIKSDDMAANMLKGSVMEYYFKGDKNHTRMNMMSGMMKSKTYHLSKNEKPIMLLELMGNKIKVVDTIKATEEEIDRSSFEVNKKITKEIAGYQCYQVKGEMKNGAILTLFVTDKIRFENNKNTTAAFGIPLDIMSDVFPLEIMIKDKGVSMTITTTKIEAKVEDTIFEYNDEGFKEMKAEDLKKMGMQF